MAELPETPAVRDDGLCVTCLGERHPEQSRKYAGVVAELDPFCSSKCAREFYGCPILNTKPTSKGRKSHHA